MLLWSEQLSGGPPDSMGCTYGSYGGLCRSPTSTVHNLHRLKIEKVTIKVGETFFFSVPSSTHKFLFNPTYPKPEITCEFGVSLCR